jgi:hypothetical protein
MFQAKVVENSETHVMCSVNIFPENCAACEIIWENMGTDGQATDDNMIRRMRIACWVTKATDTRPQYWYAYCFSTTTMVKRSRLNITLLDTACLVRNNCTNNRFARCEITLIAA